jgi:hypothetical protein
MSVFGVRRDKAALSSGCKSHPAMATSGRGSGVVGYNVQVAVDTEHHGRTR